MKHYLVETVVILALAAIAATGFHKFRTDPQKKIAFVETGRYLEPLKPPPCRDPVKVATPPSPPAPGPKKEKAPETPIVKPAQPDVPGVAPIPAPVEPGGDEVPIAEVKKAEGVIEIEFEETLEHHQAGTLFLDGRRTKQFEEGHIPGARSLPIWEGDFPQKFQAFLNDRNIDPAIPVVVYCMSLNCTDSHMLAAQLKGVGFKDVMVFKGGYPEWLKRNQPVEKGAGGAAAAAGGPETGGAR